MYPVLHTNNVLQCFDLLSNAFSFIICFCIKQFLLQGTGSLLYGKHFHTFHQFDIFPVGYPYIKGIESLVTDKQYYMQQFTLYHYTNLRVSVCVCPFVWKVSLEATCISPLSKKITFFAYLSFDVTEAVARNSQQWHDPHIKVSCCDSAESPLSLVFSPSCTHMKRWGVACLHGFRRGFE